MNVLKGDIQQLEKHRKQTVAIYKQMVIVTLFTMLGFALFAFADLPGGFIIFLALLGYLVIQGIRGSKKQRMIRAQFKEQVVGKISQEMLRLCSLPYETNRHQYHCTYAPNQRIGNHYITSSGLFPYSIDEVYGEDLFHGRIGLTDFQFSELKLVQIRTSRNSKGETVRRRVTMFHGILFVADFPKDFEGITTLRSANVMNRSSLNSWLQGLSNLFTSKKKYSIRLENEEFNRAFHIVTTDEVKARYLLPSNMMERILAFKKRHPYKVELSFVNSYMCVALSTGKDYFEPRVFKPFDGSQARAAYEDLLFFLGMIEDFDLNTRIWNKA